ncbi:Domain of uncharacterised function (DUF404) [Raoultella terrigena]|uniref:Domain of uncharacterized function (DUF404) n=1 Tax=Raoultella terrigena TaxID=577 RepID=A0A4U9CYY8_RAOTE|nr:Domain of uncharacterised function (DUF404) [Raoultella terrigena]
MHKLIKNYKADVYFDELIDHEGNPRRSAQSLIQCLDSLAPDELEKRRLTAEATIQEMGISFTVYTDKGNIDRIWPFDIIPRTIDAQDWTIAETGLKQRLTALNRLSMTCITNNIASKMASFPNISLRSRKIFAPSV